MENDRKRRTQTHEKKNGLAELKQLQATQPTSLPILLSQIMPQRKLQIPPHASMQRMETRKMPVLKRKMQICPLSMGIYPMG